MAILRFDHVQLAMPAGGEERARSFYCDVLGIPDVPKPEPLARRGGCWFELGDVRVHLGIEAEFRPARKAHPAFLVSDLTALAERLTGAGHSVAHDQQLEGFKRIFVEDPFGNRIELMERSSGGSSDDGHC